MMCLLVDILHRVNHLVIKGTYAIEMHDVEGVADGEFILGSYRPLAEGVIVVQLLFSRS